MLLTIDLHNSIRARYGLNLAVHLDGQEVENVVVADDAEGYVLHYLSDGDGRRYIDERTGSVARELLHGRVTFVARSEPRDAAQAFAANDKLGRAVEKLAAAFEVALAVAPTAQAGFHVAVNLPDTPAQVARRYRAAFGDEALERCDEDVARAEAAGLPLRHRFLERTSGLIRREDVRAGLRDEWGDRLPKAEEATEVSK